MLNTKVWSVFFTLPILLKIILEYFWFGKFVGSISEIGSNGGQSEKLAKFVILPLISAIDWNLGSFLRRKMQLSGYLLFELQQVLSHLKSNKQMFTNKSSFNEVTKENPI